MKIKLNSERQQIEKKFSMHVCGEYREHVTNNENFKILILKKKVIKWWNFLFLVK